jgi:lactaldehyde dehydrogenase/glycolaldehyde dehydrogenase
MLEKVTTKLLELAKNFKPRKILMESQADCALPLIDAAMIEGAELKWPLTKSDIWKDGHFDACILINVRKEMRICNEAIFAPVLSVLTYKTIDDAIRISNACPFGLCASIFTSNQDVILMIENEKNIKFEIIK